MCCVCEFLEYFLNMIKNVLRLNVTHINIFYKSNIKIRVHLEFYITLRIKFEKTKSIKIIIRVNLKLYESYTNTSDECINIYHMVKICTYEVSYIYMHNNFSVH